MRCSAVAGRLWQSAGLTFGRDLESRLNWVNFLLKADEFRSAFYGPVFDALKRRVFLRPLRWHANPINSRWRLVEKRSGRILRFCLGTRYLLLSPIIRRLNTIPGWRLSWEAYQDLAIKRELVGDHIGAARDFAHAIHLCPPNTALHFMRGLALLHAGAPLQATAEFEIGLHLEPNNVTLRSLAELSRQQAQSSGASVTVEASGPAPLTFKSMLWLSFSPEFLKRAVRFRTRFGGKLPSWEAYQDRGIRREAAGEFFGAAKDFARAIRLAPRNPALHYLRAMTLLRGRYPKEAAEEVLAGLTLDPDNATLRGLLQTCQHQVEAERHRGGSFAIRSKLRRVPGAPVAWCLVRRAVKVAGRLVWRPESWQAYQDRGIRRDAAGDHLGAARDFARAIATAPPNPALHYLRGSALLHGYAPDQAAAEFEAGLVLDPNNVTLRTLLAHSCAKAEYFRSVNGNWECRQPLIERIVHRIARFTYFRPVIKLHKRPLALWKAGRRTIIAGSSVKRQETTRERPLILRKQSELGPPNPALHYLRGVALLHTSDPQAAVREFEAGLRVDPENAAMRHLLEQCQTGK